MLVMAGVNVMGGVSVVPRVSVVPGVIGVRGVSVVPRVSVVPAMHALLGMRIVLLIGRMHQVLAVTVLRRRPMLMCVCTSSLVLVSHRRGLFSGARDCPMRRASVPTR